MYIKIYELLYAVFQRIYLSDGNTVCYEKVCIATGGAPKVCSLAKVLFPDRFLYFDDS